MTPREGGGEKKGRKISAPQDMPNPGRLPACLPTSVDGEIPYLVVAGPRGRGGIWEGMEVWGKGAEIGGSCMSDRAVGNRRAWRSGVCDRQVLMESMVL